MSLAGGGVVHARAKDVHVCPYSMNHCLAGVRRHHLREAMDRLGAGGTGDTSNTGDTGDTGNTGNTGTSAPSPSESSSGEVVDKHVSTAAAGSSLGLTVCPPNINKWDYVEFKGCFQYHDENYCLFPDLCAIYFQYTLLSFLFSIFEVPISKFYII